MDDRSFHLDNQVKSFRLYPPIRWKDVPLNLLLLALVVLLLTGFNFAASKLLNFLNRDALLVLIGLCVGFQLAVWIPGPGKIPGQVALEIRRRRL